MSTIIFERSVERVQIEHQPSTYRIMTGGRGPSGSDGNVNSPDNSVEHVIALTQAAYNALPSKDPKTLYIITT